MKKNFLRSFLILLITNQFYFSYTFAQDPIVDPINDEPELVQIKLNEAESKELFDVLNKWNLVVIDRGTQTKNIKTSDIICVENMEDGRRLGCSLMDDLRSRSVTKRNKPADPLFKLMVKHMTMVCEDDSETCLAAAEKMVCSLAVNKYSCSVEFFLQQPKPNHKNGELK